MEEQLNIIDGGICAPEGFKANGIQAGISHKALPSGTSEMPKSRKKKNDLGLIWSEKMCNAAAVYTQNKVKGAPIMVTKRNISNGKAQAVIVNSKNANTCNADGEEKAWGMCCLAAQELKIDPSDVIVASTGVIGQSLNISPIEKVIKELTLGLNRMGSDACATAIMTTDVHKKEIAVEFELGDKTCKIGGIAKGSGMIHPNMATMLCFMTTDTAISQDMLQKALSKVTKVTFNRVSVDGDTSTNDMACIMANGMAQNAEITTEGESLDKFCEALDTVMRYLSKEIARDGEGATKLIECCCANARDEHTAETVAKSVITSSLFKAAMFGEDANWGRILCAIGYADAEFEINRVSVSISSINGDVDVCKNGYGVNFSEETAAKVLEADEIHINIDMGSGKAEATAWGCDLSYDYVKINGDYRS